MQQQLSNRELVSHLEDLALKENEATLQLLIYLGELDRRKLYLKLGYSSLFSFCTRKLNYSEPAAYRRIASARVLRDFPSAKKLFHAREVSLTTFALVHQILRPENAEEIFQAIAGKSKESVEGIAALHKSPAAPKREVVRAIAITPPVVTNSPRAFSGEGEMLNVPNKMSPETMVTEVPSPVVALPAATVAPTPPTPTVELRYKINFEAGSSLIVKLRRLKELRPYKNLEELFELLLDSYLKQHAPENKNPSVKPSVSRSAPPNLRAMVLGRDNYQCSFVSEFGERCACRSDLEIDHIRPVAVGGKTEPENLRTLCSAHNRYESRRVLGEVIV